MGWVLLYTRVTVKAGHGVTVLKSQLCPALGALSCLLLVPRLSGIQSTFFFSFILIPTHLMKPVPAGWMWGELSTPSPAPKAVGRSWEELAANTQWAGRKGHAFPGMEARVTGGSGGFSDDAGNTNGFQWAS